MRASAVVLLCLAVALTAQAGQNPNVNLHLEFQNGSNYIAPEAAQLCTVTIYAGNVNPAGGVMCVGLLVGRSFGGVLVSSTNLLDGLEIGEPETGWILAALSCMSDSSGSVPVAELVYLYLGPGGTLELDSHPEVARDVCDCDGGEDQWCVRSDSSGHGGVWVPPPPGDCPPPDTNPHRFDVPGEFATIQAAIDSAAIGDTVLVAQGTYATSTNGEVFPISMESGVFLLSAEGRDSTIVDAEDAAGVFAFTDVDTTARMEGFTITGGYGRGGGALCSNSSPRITACAFLSNFSEMSAGALYCGDGSSPTVELCEFQGNGAFGAGGAVCCDALSTPSFETCQFCGNYGDDGGGAVYCHGGTSFHACTFTGNGALGSSGGALSCQGPVVVSECVMTANSALGDGGAASCVGSVEFYDCTIEGNDAMAAGGGIHCSSGSPTIDGCTFLGNAATIGAALDCQDADAQISDCLFAAHTAHMGVVSCAGVPAPSFATTTLSGNTVPGTDNGVLWCFNASPTLSNVIIAFNEQGKAVHREEGTAAPALACCDLYGNGGGDWVGCVAGQDSVNGNISEDPLFCDAAGAHFRLQLDSPCAAVNNQECGRIGALGIGCPATAPRMRSMADVPEDQGLQLRLNWLRSIHDSPGDSARVVSYGIYRRQDARLGGRVRLSDQGFALSERPEVLPAGAGTSRTRLEGWDYVMTVPARCDSTYQCVSPTLCDSTAAGGICWSVFLVSAMTEDPAVYFDSPPDSGYSVDNLAPAVPGGLAVNYTIVSGNELSWEASEDEDFQHFRIYRDDTEEFEPSPENLIHMTIDVAWLDPDGTPLHHYRVTALDHAGNESDPASPETVTGVQDAVPGEYAASHNFPNPFNPTTRIVYQVPAPGGAVTLRIYDTTGRIVRTLVDQWTVPGRYTAEWDGTDESGNEIGSGVYFYRLEADGVREQRSMVLLK